MVKFKVAFTIDAETLFSYVSKFMPGLIDLNVEEIFDVPKTTIQSSTDMQRKLEYLRGPSTKSKIAQLVVRKKVIPNRKIQLNKGVNKAIMNALSDNKPHKAIDIKNAMEAAGFKGTGSGSKLSKLKSKNIVFQPDIGLWQRVI
jgi:hypothetical protein